MLKEAHRNRLQSWESQQLKRRRCVALRTPSSASSIAIDGQVCVDFASNDYLALQSHPAINEAMIQGVEQYGFGSGASPMVTGYSEAHAQLEHRFAQWLKTDRALLFNSGYHANIGTIGALVKRDERIVCDRQAHSSLLEGIQLSRAQNHRYRHGDIEHLKYFLNAKPRQWLISDCLFSMDGDLAPLDAIQTLAQQYHCQLILDDAHGIGVLGDTGRGSAEYFALNQNDYAALVLPLGKAFNGMGAIVAGTEENIESVLQFAKSYRYSTALPPAICMALQASLDVVIAEPQRRNDLQNIIGYFQQQAQAVNLPLLGASCSPIQSIVIPDIAKLMQTQAQLRAHGLYVAAIRPPTVVKDTSRLRLTLNAAHTQAQVDKVLTLIASMVMA